MLSHVRLFTLLLLIFIVQCDKKFYSLLEVKEDATSDEIKKAFRKLSIKFHPDRNAGNEEIQKKYLEIQKAFETLIDVSKRSTYDLFGEQGLKNLQKTPKPKGGDFRTAMAISLQKFYTGGEELYSFNRGQICKKCRGTGDESGAVLQCPLCKGTGKMTRQVNVKGVLKNIQMTCKECKGIGIGSTNKCPVCKGQKILLKPRDLKFTVERGMADGDKVIFKGQSQQGFQFYPGDVILSLRQFRHPRFVRQGNNLKMNIEISLKQSILGFERVIKHLDGRQVEIIGDYSTQDGEQIVLKGQGMPIRGQHDKFGDLLVKVKVNYPTEYTDDQIAQMKQICEGPKEDDEDL